MAWEIRPRLAVEWRLGLREIRGSAGRSVLVATLLSASTAIAGLALTGLAIPVSFDGGDSRWRSSVLAVVGLAVIALTLAVTIPVHLVSLHRRHRDLAMLASAGADRGSLLRAALAPVVALTLPAVTLGAALAAAGAAPIFDVLDGANQAFPPRAASVPWAVLGAVLVAGGSFLTGLIPALRLVRRPMVASTDPGGGLSLVSRRVMVICAVVLAGGGYALASTGASETEPGDLATGVGLVWAGAALAVPALMALAFRVPTGASFAVVYAFRQGARSLARLVPTVLAGTACVAAATTAIAFADSSAAQGRALHVPVAPLGSVLIGGGYVDDWGTMAPLELGDAIAQVEHLAPVASAVPVRVVQVDPPSTVVDSRPIMLGSPRTTLGPMVVLTPEVAGVYGLEPKVLDAVGAGKVAIPAEFEGLVPPEGHFAISFGQDAVEVPVAAVVPHTAPAPTFVSEETARLLGLTTTQASAVVTADRALTLTDQRMLVAEGAHAVVELGAPAVGTTPTQIALLAGTGGLLALVMLGMSVLSQVEAHPEERTLQAVGADRRFLRRVAFLQSWVCALMACAAGMASGLVAAQALLLARQASYGEAYSLPDGVALVSVPWPVLAAMVVVLPVLTGAVTAMVRPSPSRV